MFSACGAAPSTHFGLACGAEGKKQNERIGNYPHTSFRGGVT
jgi:hypothetical protein